MKARRAAAALLAAGLGFALPLRASDLIDAKKLEALVGRPLVAQGNGEYKVVVPQEELAVVDDGVALIPEMGLTSWVAFSPHGSGVMAMGDVVLLEDEVGAVQKTAVSAGLTATGLHNHFLRETPKVMFMHVGGSGPLDKLASGVRQVLETVDRLRASRKKPSSPPTVPSTLDAKKLEGILGHGGKESHGVYKVVIARPDVSLEAHGEGVDSFLGFNTWMAFQGTMEKAAVSGDFAMLEDEVEGVVGELVLHGIEVTAIHNHMVGETPRVVFLHFWGVGPAADLAQGLRAALVKQKK